MERRGGATEIVVLECMSTWLHVPTRTTSRSSSEWAEIPQHRVQGETLNRTSSEMVPQLDRFRSSSRFSFLPSPRPPRRQANVLVHAPTLCNRVARELTALLDRGRVRSATLASRKTLPSSVSMWQQLQALPILGVCFGLRQIVKLVLRIRMPSYTTNQPRETCRSRFDNFPTRDLRRKILAPPEILTLFPRTRTRHQPWRQCRSRGPRQPRVRQMPPSWIRRPRCRRDSSPAASRQPCIPPPRRAPISSRR